jgi:predicted 3-demethylubiquinone-9 3-methyltransferase (glyoxalase superfamily)
MQKIIPHLWFDKEAKEAAEYYVSVFSAKGGSAFGGGDSKVTSVQTIHGTPSGDVDIVAFTLRGQDFMAMSAGPLFKFNESVSFIVECEDQTEIDYFWSKLSAVPASEQCGWCKDKYGLSWQVIPRMMGKFIEANPARVTQAFLKMKKIIIADLEAA